MDFTKQSPVILSFCPGIRGIERGLERVFHSVRVAAFVEIETFIVENLLAAMEAGMVAPAPVWTNLKTFRPEPFRGLIDGIIGGYPCQPFSVAGDRKGEDDPRHLWPFIRRSIEVIQPGWCFFENVAGHLSLGFDVVKRELEEMGYFVEAGIYTAEEVGAPQKRERLFILGIRMEDAYRSRDEESELFHSSISAESSEELEHSESRRYGGLRNEISEREGCRIVRRGSNGGTDEELADTRLLGQTKRQEQTARTEQCSTELADPSSARNETRIPGQEQREEGFAGVANNNSVEHRFPAGQGVYQHEWEEPRTFESSLEYTINGYNFTEDLHRAIGNSVVEQTAELAFRDLHRKITEWFEFV